MLINSEAVHTTMISDGQIIVANTMTGDYLKTNKLYFDVITDIVKTYGTLEKFFETSSADTEIKRNLEQLYQSLIKLNFFIKSYENTVSNQKYDEIYVAVTNRCNLKCKHCCQDSGCMEHDNLSTDELCKIIDVISSLEPKGIIFTGGEPLMRNDMIKLLRYAKSKFKGQIILATNAILINEDNIEPIIENITGISISIDGYNEESCRKVRGNNVFREVISKIEMLKEHGLENISISAIYTKYMEGHEKDFIELCEKYEAKPIIRNLFLTGRADLNEYELMPSNYIERLVQERGVSCRHCRAGEREMFIDVNADVFPCPLLQSAEFRCGNLLDSKFQQELNKRKMGEISRNKMENYRTWNNEACKNCEIGLFCQTCEAEYIMLRNNKHLLKEYCKEKMKFISGKRDDLECKE